jgi:hypothetical protein
MPDQTMVAFKQIKFDQAQPGLVIKAIDASNGKLTILFTDNTFVHIEPVYDEWSSWLRDEEVDLTTQKYLIRDSERFIELGILDRAEYEAAEKVYLEAHERRNREYKRQQYEALRKDLGL